MAKICGQCGAQFPDTANICGNCGAPLAAPAQPVQPQYQAPAAPYQYAPVAPKKPATETVTELVVKFLGVATLVFVCLAGVAFIYKFIAAIVGSSVTNDIMSAFGADSSSFSFGAFCGGVAEAIAAAAKYTFYAIVTTIGAKLLKK